MRTSHLFAILLRPLHSYTEAVTPRADHQARSAGLTVEVLDRGRRRYRDPRLDDLASGRQLAGRSLEVEQWSTPTLTATPSAGWPL